MAGEAEPAKKILLPFLQRADELQKHEPLVAYYCRLYALERGLKIPAKRRTKTTSAILAMIMSQLEKDKKSLELNTEDNFYIEGFALNVFSKADNRDRSGQADMNTAKKFYAASIFIEILRQFGELQPDIEEKQIYSAWKAADIRKALSEGRRPVPGPPHVEKKQFASSSGGLDHLSPLKEAVKTQGQRPAVEQDSNARLAIPTGSQQETSPSKVLQTASKFHETGNPYHVPSPRRSPNPSVPGCTPSYAGSYHQPSSIPGPVTSLSMAQVEHGQGAQSDSSHSVSFHASHNQHSPALRDASNSSNMVKFSASDYSSSPLGHIGSAQLKEYSGLERAHSVSVTVTGQGYQPEPKKIAAAHKSARLAVSSLAFDDVPTAISYLKQSLKLLTNPSA